MSKCVFASACVLAGALFSSAATAEISGVAGTLDGNYGNVAGVPTWSVNGAADVPLGWEGLSIEGDLGQVGSGKPGIYGHLSNGGGNLVWSDPSGQFRIAGSYNYNQFKVEGLTLDEQQYGGGGQWFFNQWLTVSADGGGVAGKVSGSYVDGDVKGYWIPDLAFDGFVHYLNGSITGASGHITDLGVHVEWLPEEEVPLSFGARYDHLEASGTINGFGSASGNTDAWFVTLKFYVNDSPASSLEDRQRTGVLDDIKPSLLFLP